MAKHTLFIDATLLVCLAFVNLEHNGLDVVIMGPVHVDIYPFATCVGNQVQEDVAESESSSVVTAE